MTRLGRLVRDRRARDAEAVTIIDGPRPLSTAIDCAAVVEAVFARPDRYAEVVEIAGTGVEVFEVEAEILDRLADSETPQGVLAVAERVDLAVDEVVDLARIVVIDGVQDPGNAGAIVRTAAAAGFDAVIAGVGTADLWSPRSVRASAGTVFALDVVRRVDVAQALATLGEAGHRRVATSADAQIDVDLLETAPLMTLVLGSEAHGVSEAALAEIDVEIAVPMAAPVESLNVAVTAGIVMYRMR